METLAGTASAIAIVQVADRVVNLCGTYAFGVAGAKKEREKLINEVKSLRDVADSVNSAMNGSAKVMEALSLCEMELSSLKQKLKPSDGRKVMSKIGLRALTWPFKSKDIEKIIIGLERRKTLLLLALSVEQNFRSNEMQRYAVLSKLENARNARYNAESETSKPFCQHGTRVDILRHISRWSQDEGSKPIFWLNGMAGTGKSTIARTVARELERENALGASFFFFRGAEDLSNVRKFPSTIASQLCSVLLPLKSHVAAAIEENAQVMFENAREQCRRLIIKPIQQLTDFRRVFLVLDALDECDEDYTGHDLKLVLQLVSEITAVESVSIKLFITSRPETALRLAFDSTLRGLFEELSLHSIHSDTISSDINSYLTRELELFREEHTLSKDWPKNEDIAMLSNRANGLFIYAATIVRFVQSSKIQPPEYRLSKLLQDPITEHSPTGQLDKIYGEVLRLSLLDGEEADEDNDSFQRFKDVFGPLLVLYDPLDPLNLSNLVKIDYNMSFSILRSIPSLVFAQYDQPVTLLHPSLRDYLFNKNRCIEIGLHIDRVQAHRFLAIRCILCMHDELRQDICDLKDPGCLRSSISLETLYDAVPAHLRYACRYWVDHVEAGACALDLISEILHFLQHRLLQWIEVLGLFGWVSDGIKLVQRLKDAFYISKSREPKLKSRLEGRNLGPATLKSKLIDEFLVDTNQLLRRYRYGIEESPLQVYSLGTIFSLQDGILLNHYRSLAPNQILIPPKLYSRWDQTLYSLKGHSRHVFAVCFSPNNQLLASGSLDCSCKLWDMNTGSLVYTLDDHFDRIDALIFADDCTLISGSQDTTIKVWDASNGLLDTTLRGHSSGITGFSIFATQKLLISSSADKTLKIWHMQESTLLMTLEGHTDWIRSICCYRSLGRNLVASASVDWTIKIWDLGNMQMTRSLEHQEAVYDVVCDPDGSFIASSDFRGTVSVWEPGAGQLMRELGIKDNHRREIAYLPSKKMLITMCWAYIEYWSLDTFTCVHVMPGESQFPPVFSCSLDNNLMAVASHANSVQIRKVDTKTLDNKMELAAARVFHISKDWSFAATGQMNGTVSVWCTDTGYLQYRLENHRLPVTILVFSNDDTLLASADAGGLVNVWNLDTRQIYTRLDLGSRVVQITFLHNRKLLARTITRRSTKIWDLETRSSCHEFSHQYRVNNATVSMDGRWLAETPVLQKTNLQMWDLTTDQLRFEVYGSSFTSAVAFSGDSKYVVSSSFPEIRVHELETGQSVLTFTETEQVSPALALSFNGKFLAFRNTRKTVAILSVSQDEVLCEVSVGDQDLDDDFCFDGNDLIAKCGRISLKNLQEDRDDLEVKPFKDIWIEEDWLILHDKRVLWIPPELQRDLVVLPGYRVAIFDRYKFTVMKLKPPD